MTDIEREIERVKKAIVETNSPYLRRDYTKYLKKLYRKMRGEIYGQKRT